MYLQFYYGIYPIPNKLTFTYMYDCYVLFNYNKKYVIYVVYSMKQIHVFFIGSYQLGPDETDKWDTLQGRCYN